MAHTYIGIFNDSERAGKAVAELKEKGFAKELSVVAKDNKGTTSHTVDEQVSDGAAGGAVVGATMAGLAAFLTGATSIALPGIGLLVAGPLATILTSAVAGAATGGLVGALVDKGIPDETARMYEDRVRHGEVLVSVDADESRRNEIESIFMKYGSEGQSAHM